MPYVVTMWGRCVEGTWISSSMVGGATFTIDTSRNVMNPAVLRKASTSPGRRRRGSSGSEVVSGMGSEVDMALQGKKGKHICASKGTGTEQMDPVGTPISSSTLAPGIN
ncbi:MULTISPECIES: hypothetical protein [Nocardiopsis]|uniref:hypothetical protein n=1 Tax=Nocardiopsis TaxID=2013 RepID=UPI00197CC5F9|nr:MULTISPECIES: hypothetical protein [Nocardiopsis]